MPIRFAQSSYEVAPGFTCNTTERSTNCDPDAVRNIKKARQDYVPACRNSVENQLSHFSPQLCYSPPYEWLRHPEGSGTRWTRERFNDHDLYPCPESGRDGGEKPIGVLNPSSYHKLPPLHRCAEKTASVHCRNKKGVVSRKFHQNISCY